ncbi:MAG: hypothetical protein RMH75_05975 [Archaeoglobaceae archaeon]|nr:hypothetical protein [Archaeoglobaceae archaeon]
MELLRLEFDLQHHLVLSRRDDYHHALIRLILSTLASPLEIANLSLKNFKIKDGVFIVRFSGFKSRISPIDQETFRIVESLKRDRPFEIEEKEMDEIVSRYSPKDRRYTAKSLKKAMVNFLKDASLFNLDFERLSLKELCDFMEDFNPLYSGTWLDEDGLKEFILNYSVFNKIYDSKKIAEETGVDGDFVSEVMRTGKSVFSLARKFDSKKFIS